MKAGSVGFDRDGMHIVILVPPAAGLGLRTALGCGLGLPLTAGLTLAAGADAAAADEAATDTGALLGGVAAGVPPQAASVNARPPTRALAFTRRLLAQPRINSGVDHAVQTSATDRPNGRMHILQPKAMGAHQIQGKAS